MPESGFVGGARSGTVCRLDSIVKRCTHVYTHYGHGIDDQLGNHRCSDH
jgi:hypothetical protein